MIVPLRLRSLDQLIARVLRSTYYYKTTDRRALCLTTIITAASTVLLPDQTAATPTADLNSTLAALPIASY
jgi:hypothetical protein